MAGFGYSFSGCFLASMPGSFVSSRQKTQIEAIRLFRVYTSSKKTGDQREVSVFFVFSAAAGRGPRPAPCNFIVLNAAIVNHGSMRLGSFQATAEECLNGVQGCTQFDARKAISMVDNTG